jgi:hypothetical protein
MPPAQSGDTLSFATGPVIGAHVPNDRAQSFGPRNIAAIGPKG